MINVTTQWSNHHILERIHIPGRPCFGDDDDHNDIQNTHGQPPSMLSATKPVTQNFSHYPSQTPRALLATALCPVRNTFLSFR